MFRSVITGSGSYIPPHKQANVDFASHAFYGEDRQALTTPPLEVIEKFRQITGIEERRYTTGNLNASDIGGLAAKAALIDSGADPESIDQIIVAHNFGDVVNDTIQTDVVPSVANHIKHYLSIRNPDCVAYDIVFGCPGWVQGLIQADAFFKAGIAKKALVIGTETLSRVIDMYDRDSMIFSDGAGAVVMEYLETGIDGRGILGAAAKSFSGKELEYINLGGSYYPGSDPRIRFIKMKGRKVYEFAMMQVPTAMKECLDKCDVPIHALKKVFIHQANEKMDEAILKRMYQLYGIDEPPANIMPMSIHWLGNSSVATVPTLYDLVCKGQLAPHELTAGDIILFASVGAGMNINSVCYRY